jgi:hypothetical protein
MLRSGLVNQHRARFEEGFPHERNNHPRDKLIRPYVQDEVYPTLKRGRYTEPELPFNDPNPVQPKYIDIFGKKTTPDERLYLYKEFFNAAKKFGVIPGQATVPQNANGAPGTMYPQPPLPPPADPQGGPPGGPQDPPRGPDPYRFPRAPSMMGATEVGVEYTSELAAQSLVNGVSGNIGESNPREADEATEGWTAGLLKQMTRWGKNTRPDDYLFDTNVQMPRVVDTVFDESRAIMPAQGSSQLVRGGNSIGSSSQVVTAFEPVTPSIQFDPAIINFEPYDDQTIKNVIREKWGQGMSEGQITKFIGKKYGPKAQTDLEISSLKSRSEQTEIVVIGVADRISKIEKTIQKAEAVNKLGPAHNLRTRTKTVTYTGPVTINNYIGKPSSSDSSYDENPKKIKVKVKKERKRK